MNEEEFRTALRELDNNPSLDNIKEFYDEKNIFRILSIEGNEIRHSNFLAWLLNPKGHHGLGDGFLNALLGKLGFKDVDTSEVVVEREKLHIDLLVYSPKGKWFFIIENKTWTKDHGNQLKRYIEDVETYLVGYESKHHAYLTPSGEDPTEDYDSEKWINVDYGFIKESIKRLNESNADNKAKIYIDDYIHILEDSLLMENEEELRKMCLDVYAKHKNAIDTINRFVGDEAAMRTDAFIKTIESFKDKGIEIGTSTNVYTRFITNSLAEVVKGKGIPSWGGENKYLIMYEVSSNKNTDSLNVQVVLSPAGEGFEDDRKRIIDRFKEDRKMYNTNPLKKNKVVDNWVWVKVIELVNKSEFKDSSKEALAQRLEEYINSNEFKNMNEKIVSDVKTALGK